MVCDACGEKLELMEIVLPNSNDEYEWKCVNDLCENKGHGR